MAEKVGEREGVVGVDVLGRRKYTVEFKRGLVELALEPGASVAGIALAHQLNANQLFKWRRWYQRQQGAMAVKPQGGTTREPDATLLPVVVASASRPRLDSEASVSGATTRDAVPSVAPGQIEVALGRARVRVTGVVDPALVERILRCIPQR